MDLEYSGCTWQFVAVVLLVVLAAAVILPGLSGLQDAAAERDRAHAAEIHAQADLEYTRSTAWQERFMLWTTYLQYQAEDSTTALVVVAACLGALAALPVTLWLSRLAARHDRSRPFPAETGRAGKEEPPPRGG